MKKFKVCRSLSISNSFCIDCGIEISGGAKRCRSCSSSLIARRRYTRGDNWGEKTRFYKGHKIWLGRHLSNEHKLKLAIVHEGLKHLSPKDREKFLVSGKIHRYKKGKRHPNWQGGITSKNGERLNEFFWKKLAKKVRKGNKYECQNKDCGKKAYSVHHKIPWRISKDNSMNNLITLCSSCHLKADKAFNRKGVVLYGTQ